MQRFCCFPFNETPEINVRMDCISTCCASDTKTEDTNVSDNTEHSIGREKKRSCFCKKRRTYLKNQANVDQGTKITEVKNE